MSLLVNLSIKKWKNLETPLSNFAGPIGISRLINKRKFRVNAAKIQPFEIDFVESLANKPYCTDVLGVTFIRPKETAIKKAYLQVNRPTLTTYLVFDIDRAGGVLAWEDAGLPPPLWTTKTQANAHGHLAYKINIPVATSDAAHIEPIKYLAAIQSAMMERLQADRSYAGLLTKNPLSEQWQTTIWTRHAYSLDELADYLDLKGHPLKGNESIGLGRNCDIFENVRVWSYKAIRDYWQPNYLPKWEKAVLARVEAQNGQYEVPLPYTEIKALAKSIAKWTYREFTPLKKQQWHARKGAKGGKIGGKISKGGGRPIGSVNVESANQAKPWNELGIGKTKYYQLKKLGKLNSEN